MNLEHHSISIHFVVTLIKAAKIKGLNYKLLLQKADMTENMLKNTQLRITPDQFSRFMREMWKMGDDEFLGLANERSRHGVFTLMAKQAANCPDLRSVYRHMSHFYNLVTNAFNLEFKIIGNDVHFSMQLADNNQDPDNSLREFLMLVWHRFPSWLIGQRVPLKRILLDYPEPEHVAEYRLMYPCPAIFNHTTNSLVFDVKYLKAEKVQTAQSLRGYLRRAPLDWFMRQAYYQVFTQRVVNYIENSEQLALCNMDEVARHLHLTTRTLRRKLTEENTSFQELKDNVRRDAAIHYLSQQRIPVSQISRLLGYSEPAAFTRAFKIWTGVTPKVYRSK